MIKTGFTKFAACGGGGGGGGGGGAASGGGGGLIRTLKSLKNWRYPNRRSGVAFFLLGVSNISRCRAGPNV